MFEEFITKHRRITIAIAVLITLGMISFVVWSISQQFSQPVDSPEILVDDDSGGGQLLLPYNNPLYTLSQNPTKIPSVPDDHNVLIDALDGYRTAAAMEIYRLGFDPTDYKLTFTNESPFTPYE